MVVAVRGGSAAIVADWVAPFLFTVIYCLYVKCERIIRDGTALTSTLAIFSASNVVTKKRKCNRSIKLGLFTVSHLSLFIVLLPKHEHSVSSYPFKLKF